MILPIVCAMQIFKSGNLIQSESCWYISSNNVRTISFIVTDCCAL